MMEMQLCHSTTSNTTLGAIDEDDEIEAGPAVAQKQSKKGKKLQGRIWMQRLDRCQRRRRHPELSILASSQKNGMAMGSS